MVKIPQNWWKKNKMGGKVQKKIGRKAQKHMKKTQNGWKKFPKWT